MKYIIPAREGSKGLRHKNRHLFEYTAKIIPPDERDQVYVTTDDEWIIEKSIQYKFNYIRRDDSLCKDDVSIKLVLQDVVEKANIQEDILMLYLTYPKRTWKDVTDFISYYYQNDKNPTICKKDVDNHPYLCYYEMCDSKGKKVIDHNLYRRQDYPSCFQICHFLFACSHTDLGKLDLNLFCDDTLFYHISEEKCLDIDSSKDFKKL